MWVVRNGDNLYRDEGPRHECRPPRDSFGQADGHLGDVWRCDECETLWVHRVEPEPFGPVKGYRARAFYWKRAGWRLRRRHRREGFT